jgi:hypothetical protein
VTMRTGRCLVILASLAASAALASFSPGTRFGTVGLDYRLAGGDSFVYYYSPDSQFAPVDPFFRVGTFVTPGLAVGADLALLHTFPKHGDLFLNTPIFAFGPVATWTPVQLSRFQAYATAGAGVAFDFMRRQGWRARAGVGALFDVGIPVTFGPEVGYYADVVHIKTPYQSSRYTASAIFIGLRLSDLRL